MKKDELLVRLENIKKECTGCSACFNVCPVNAISMKSDDTGFMIPNIDENICIDCHKCVQTCPVLTPIEKQNTPEPKCFAAMADDKIRKLSSSGGAFSIIAGYILSCNGFVAGAKMEPDLTVHHTLIDSEKDLDSLRKSKYVQSEIGTVYKSIKQKLHENKVVLFTGTPCQIAGLYAYLYGHPDNLFTIDILCHGVPSHKMLVESLEDMAPDKKIVHIDFRDKNFGWESLAMTLKFSDNRKQRISYDESRYEQGFHPGMTLRESCYNCSFCEFPRLGDLSIGDFWRIDESHPELADGKGTSAILVNNDKGKFLIEECLERFKHIKQVPLKLLEHNRISAKTYRDPARQRFLELYKSHSFNKSVFLAQQGMYDIGLVGNWSYPNYGSELTYYALFNILESLGRSVLLISWPKDSNWKPYEKAQLFKQNPYQSFDIGPLPESRADLYSLGRRCETYVLGSDQLLNNNLYLAFNRFMQLDWVPGYKRKIAYAASFGADYIWGKTSDHAELGKFLRKFNNVSVRESSGKTLLKNHYGVDAQVVLDPIFIVSSDKLQNLADRGNERVPSSKYLFAYVLDLNAAKATFVRKYAKDLNLDLYSATDAAPESHRVESKWDIPTLYNVKLEEWIAYIKNCSFMITDSFHGMCLAILFHKPFIAINNASRGNTRFVEILNKLGLMNRLVDLEIDNSTTENKILDIIDYDDVEKRLSNEREKSLKWIIDALDAPIPLNLSDYDLLAPICSRMEISDQKQWQQLEDHRLRLDGIDDCDKRQWEQLNDAMARLKTLEGEMESIKSITLKNIFKHIIFKLKNKNV